MKKSYIIVKRIADNKYCWESQTQNRSSLNQTEVLLLLGGVLGVAITDAMNVDDELMIDMSIKSKKA